jgi:hypothetical protein
VCPNEFLGYGAFWDRTQLVEVWSLFEVYIQTITEASVSLAKECGLVYSERKGDLTPTVTKTGERRLAHLLREPQ